MLMETEFAGAVQVQGRTHHTPGLPPATHATAISYYAPNAMIYAQGDTAGPLYQVAFGAVRICRLTADGRRQISAFHFAGEVFGFEATSEHHFCAESIEGTGIRVLRAATGDGYAGQILPLALAGLSRAQEHLLVLGRQNATERLAAFLLDLNDRQGNHEEIDLPMQRLDIADYLGLTFETVSRVFRRLKDARIVALPTARHVDILDLGALETLCE